jgi:hypothetical protein
LQSFKNQKNPTLSNPKPSHPLRLCASARENLHPQPANRERITRFEQKIQTTLARVWGEAEPACVDSGEKVVT